jgi:NNP family nitrate/nitrite transporter-like MFS transporter
MQRRDPGFLKAGHLPTLLAAFLYFDLCFAVWVLNAALAPFITQDLGLTHAQKGLMLSVPVFVGALLRLPLGVLSQYIGRKRAAQLEMGLIVAGLLVGWLVVDSFASVLIMDVILGVAGASFGVALALGAGSYPPRYKGLAMGIAGAGNSGAVLAMIFAPPLAREFGWQAVYGLAILPMLLTMALVQIFAKEPADREEKKDLRAYLKIFVDRDAWVFNLVYIVTFGGYIGLTSFLPTLFKDQYAIPGQSIERYSALIVIAASVLRVTGGLLADRVGGLRLLFVLLAGIAGSMVAAASIPGEPWTMVLVLLFAFAAMGAGNGAVFQLVPLRFGGSTAVASGLIGAVGGLGGGFVAALMGLGMEWSGTYAPGFLFLTVLAAAGLVMLAVVARTWTSSWLGAGGRARESAADPAKDVTRTDGKLAGQEVARG